MNFCYNLSKKYAVKIPKNILVIYSENLKVIVLLGPFGTKTFKLKTKVFLNSHKNKIYVTKLSFLKMSQNRIKELKNFQGTLVSLLKQSVLEISILLYQKLKFVGVGYRAFLLDLPLFQVLRLRIGYSHQVYFKLTKTINLFCFKATTLFIFGHFYHMINSISAKFRSYKIPEYYKGKGILYENETIILKKGKKI